MKRRVVDTAPGSTSCNAPQERACGSSGAECTARKVNEPDQRCVRGTGSGLPCLEAREAWRRYEAQAGGNAASEVIEASGGIAHHNIDSSPCVEGSGDERFRVVFVRLQEARRQQQQLDLSQFTGRRCGQQPEDTPLVGTGKVEDVVDECGVRGLSQRRSEGCDDGLDVGW
jgi:hypothetical protein